MQELEKAETISADEMRYTVPLLRGVVFLRRPVTMLPADGTICFVDAGDRTGRSRAMACGVYQSGQWTNGKGKALAFEPTYWTIMEGWDDAK